MGLASFGFVNVFADPLFSAYMLMMKMVWHDAPVYIASRNTISLTAKSSGKKENPSCGNVQGAIRKKLMWVLVILCVAKSKKFIG